MKTLPSMWTVFLGFQTALYDVPQGRTRHYPELRQREAVLTVVRLSAHL